MSFKLPDIEQSKFQIGDLASLNIHLWGTSNIITGDEAFRKNFPDGIPKGTLGIVVDITCVLWDTVYFQIITHDSSAIILKMYGMYFDNVESDVM